MTFPGGPSSKGPSLSLSQLSPAVPRAGAESTRHCPGLPASPGGGGGGGCSETLGVRHRAGDAPHAFGLGHRPARGDLPWRVLLKWHDLIAGQLKAARAASRRLRVELLQPGCGDKKPAEGGRAAVAGPGVGAVPDPRWGRLGDARRSLTPRTKREQRGSEAVGCRTAPTGPSCWRPAAGGSLGGRALTRALPSVRPRREDGGAPALGVAGGPLQRHHAQAVPAEERHLQEVRR